MTTAAPNLGIIAGAGALPGLLVKACVASGRGCHVLGLTGFADTALVPVDHWIHMGEAGRAFTLFRAAGVTDIVLAGGVRRPALSDIKPDLKGVGILARIAARLLPGVGDDSLLSAVIAEFEREGFRVVGADQILTDLLAPEGPLGTVAPDEGACADIAVGLEAARALGAADRGQAVLVLAGAVVGTEDVEGTDALMARAGSKGAILVKAKKPQQERRADLPTIGPDTVVNAARAGLKGIAVEAGHTLVIGRDAVAREADARGLFVVGVSA
jgi:DUF1009 family protein